MTFASSGPLLIAAECAGICVQLEQNVMKGLIQYCMKFILTSVHFPLLRERPVCRDAAVCLHLCLPRML